MKQKEITKIAFQELELNMKYQNINLKDCFSIGYEFDNGVYVLQIFINLKKLKEQNKNETKIS